MLVQVIATLMRLKKEVKLSSVPWLFEWAATVKITRREALPMMKHLLTFPSKAGVLAQGKKCNGFDDKTVQIVLIWPGLFL